MATIRADLRLKPARLIEKIKQTGCREAEILSALERNGAFVSVWGLDVEGARFQLALECEISADGTLSCEITAEEFLRRSRSLLLHKLRYPTTEAHRKSTDEAVSMIDDFLDG